jgi:hypothetical protein
MQEGLVSANVALLVASSCSMQLEWVGQPELLKLLH